MRIIYSRDFEERYSTNPVENPERVRLPAKELSNAGYKFVEPVPARPEDIHKVHGLEHMEFVRHRGLYDAAALAAGGAICAAELALQGEPAFALIRPPGHHASANRAWGLCFFNNMAIAVRKIKERIGKILILDIDLHFGDGTVSIFRGDREVTIVNPASVDINFEYLQINGSGYLADVKEALESSHYNIIGVSAGFDTYIEDWGRLLTNEEFRKIGQAIKEASAEKCEGRRFAILEGGYHPDLKYNIRSFISGFE